MISINNISYYVGGRPLYENASLHIKPRDRIGLIGLNGKGKTTLLRLLDRSLLIDSGEISFSNECTIGFLNQDLLSYESDDSILGIAMQAFKRVNELKVKIDEILKKLETDYSDDLIEKLGKYQEEFEKKGGYTAESAAEEVLEGIGFTTEELSRPLKSFSGGWRMRVMLAKLLLEKPSLLMLDEPTNHLDLPSIEWVENYMRGYEGAIIVVSHDRDFLNNVVTSIVEVDQLKLVQYTGNYNFYQQEKALRKEIQQNTYENQQKQIRQTERFIERFRAKSTKARQVQSRVKQLERMDIVEEVAAENASINFKFNLQTRSGKVVMDLKDTGKSYGENEVLRNTTLHINRGDKIALVGANGKGKSTLLRMISGTEPHLGERNEGHNVRLGFYAQHQLESLDVHNDILTELKVSGSGKPEQELRSVLGCFLFSDEDVFKKIKVLSGGEKSRVALAKTLISEANFLLLDEPTNHLDFISENILIQALQQYEGTFITVSHNRHFVKEVANKVWYIDDKQVKEYPGTFDEYMFWVSKKPDEEKQEESSKPEKVKKTKIKSVDETKVLEKQAAELEEKIFRLEEKKDLLESDMLKPGIQSDSEKLQEITTQYEEVLIQLKTASQQWEEVINQMD